LRHQRHDNRHNNCRIGHRLKMSLQIAKASAFSESERAIPPGVTRVYGLGTLITRLVILRSDCSSGSRNSSVALHWSFLHSLRRRVNDLCRPLASAFRTGSLVICHCLPSRIFGLSGPECRPVSKAVGRHAGDVWKLALPEPSKL